MALLPNAAAVVVKAEAASGSHSRGVDMLEAGVGSEQTTVEVLVLGAGQDVGRSCLVLRVGGVRLMLDCGMHLSHNDYQRFPDFRRLSLSGNVDSAIDGVLLSHFHLDHCGALPILTELTNYKGPVYMTEATRALASVMLRDYRRVSVEKQGETNFFTDDHIDACLSKATLVSLNHPVHLPCGATITAYPAGHVLGAVMFAINVDGTSVLYTGDFNMTSDRLLSAALPPIGLAPHVLISESTLASESTRGSRREAERAFLQQVTQTVLRDGKVLIPVHAVGRVQELAVILEAHWKRSGLHVPIYFSSYVAGQANKEFQAHAEWANVDVRETLQSENPFDWRFVQPYDRQVLIARGPAVLFSTPGSLESGVSSQAFAAWGEDPNNLLIVPSKCGAGPLAHRLLHEAASRTADSPPRCEVSAVSFSAHTDDKGILQMIRAVQPQQLVLVHGTAGEMFEFQKLVERTMRVPTHVPANGDTLKLLVPKASTALISSDVLPQPSKWNWNFLKPQPVPESKGDDGDSLAVVIREGGKFPRIMRPEEAAVECRVPPLRLSIAHQAQSLAAIAGLIQEQASVAADVVEVTEDCISLPGGVAIFTDASKNIQVSIDPVVSQQQAASIRAALHGISTFASPPSKSTDPVSSAPSAASTPAKKRRRE